jgi:mono/diheme cytochrome c family protein
MKIVLRIVLYTLLLMVVAAGGFITFLEYQRYSKYAAPTIPEFKVESTPERIAVGTKIASVQCIVCHRAKDNKLVGRFLSELPDNFGKIYSANITHSKEHGIGGWTDSEIAYFLRTGVRKNGQYAPIYMPKFAHLSDEDLRSVIAWLRSDNPAGSYRSRNHTLSAQPFDKISVPRGIQTYPLSQSGNTTT